jgi:membrane-bound lytic murein transglycosylase B
MSPILRRLLLALLVVLALPDAAWANKAKAPKIAVEDGPFSYATRQDVRDFAAQVAARQQLPPEWVQTQLAQARREPAAQRLMMPPPTGTAKNWAAYRDRFVEPQRIAAGMRFWQDNAEWLQRAERRYGVPPQIVVGIVGVETFYGRITGNFRVLDVLATLSFDFPTGRSDRSAFFRDELEAYLLLCRGEGLDPTTPKGSFAGAMGLPQFMPSSINRYAVDFDGDGRIDLLNSPADVIGSVANYLKQHGWRPGEPVALPATPTSEARAAIAADAVPVARKTPVQRTRPAGDLAALGIAAAEPIDLAAPAVLLHLDGPEDEYWLGLDNFFVITRYNRSNLYAMAVHQLGREIKALYLARESRQAAANQGSAQ